MANETEFSNFNTVAAYVAANVVPVFEPLVVGRGWAQEQMIMDATKAYKFTIEGSLTASTTSESAQATKSEYTETAVTITAVKSKVYTELSEEAELYIGSPALEKLIDKAGRALAQKWDADFFANFQNFSTSVGASATAVTTDHLLQATYELDADDAVGARAFFLHSKQLYQIVDEIKDASGRGLDKAYAGLLARNANESALRGTLFDVPVYASTAITDDATDFEGALVSEYALGVVMANGGMPIVTINDDPEYGLKKIGISAYWAFGELKDVGGVQINTDV